MMRFSFLMRFYRCDGTCWKSSGRKYGPVSLKMVHFYDICDVFCDVYDVIRDVYDVFCDVCDVI